jgi:hypothetical protein
MSSFNIPPLPYLDATGKPLPSIAGLKIGDTVYMQVMGKLTACTVTNTNPFSVKSN